jgi:hypothetical protein
VQGDTLRYVRGSNQPGGVLGDDVRGRRGNRFGRSAEHDRRNHSSASPISAELRFQHDSLRWRNGPGVGDVRHRRGGSGVAADVRLVTAQPDTHYDVGLIQAPRPSSATCGPGDPGTAFGSLNTDGAGAGAVTVQDGIRPGTTGVWVVIQRLNEHSQNPAEFYTSDFIAPV